MTLDAILSQVKITEVFRSLGGEVRSNRGKAFYREGTNWTIQFCDKRNFFTDHAASVSGGVLKLVELCRQCSRAEAIAYVEQYVGAQLGQNDTPDLPAARAWRDAEIQDKEELLASWDCLKIEVDRRFTGDTRFRKWKMLCRQQGDMRREIEHLKALTGRELVAAYRASLRVMAVGA